MHSGCTLLAKATNSGRVILYLLNVATEHLQKNVAAFFLRSRMKKGEKQHYTKAPEKCGKKSCMYTSFQTLHIMMLVVKRQSLHGTLTTFLGGQKCFISGK